MTQATDLSEAIQARLEAITPANGYHSAVARVYGFGETKPDRAPTPYILARIVSDELEKAVGSKASRLIVYEFEGVLPRTASLQDLQCLHHDILKTLGVDSLPGVRPLQSGWLFEESAEFDPDHNGSTARTVISTITLRYVETY